jgi:hypothetical protein
MYHLELRKFPHVVCRFNQSEAQLHALVVAWTRQEWVEEGERKWNVNEASLTILEGPKLSMPELAMGKGWRNAQKRSQDVTERVLGAARDGLLQGEGGGASAGHEPPAEPVAGGAAAGDLDLLADSLGLELLGLLDGEPVAPRRAWAMARERLAERRGSASAAEALALAERAVRALLERRLAVLRAEDGGGVGRETEVGREGGGEGGGEGEKAEAERRERQDAILAAVETWAGDGPSPVALARKS